MASYGSQANICGSLCKLLCRILTKKRWRDEDYPRQQVWLNDNKIDIGRKHFVFVALQNDIWSSFFNLLLQKDKWEFIMTWEERYEGEDNTFVRFHHTAAEDNRAELDTRLQAKDAHASLLFDDYRFPVH